MTTQYHHTLLDIRQEMYRRFALLAIIFYGLAAYVTLLMQPFPLDLFALPLLTGIAVLWLRRLPHPYLPRYVFIGLLHISLIGAMARLETAWLPFLGLPLLWISAFLVARGAVISVVSVPLAALLLNWGAGTGFAVGGIVVLHVITFAVALVTVSRFHTALTWYSSMHERANLLLEETRDRRAELVNTLRSLETAYQTQRRTQQQLIYARKRANEAQRMKEQFAANISHELRTPLNLILGFSEIMYLTPEVYGDVQFPPRLYRDIAQIYRSSRYLLEMVDDVLDLSHIELSGFSLDFRLTDLNAFLSETADMLRNLFQGKPVVFIVQLEDNLPTIEIDRTRVRQILLNLMNNAQRFTAAGAVTLRVYTEADAVVFCVTDTGIGIPSDKLPYVFDEFFQVDYSLSRTHGGAGLGLAITRRFVEAHGGNIHIESEEGIGTTIVFRLPLRESEQSGMRTVEPDAAPDQIVLVLDPDPAVAGMIRRYLEGYTVIAVTHPADLPALIQEQLPRAVIRNRTPNNAPRTPLPVPEIELGLPSSAWMMRHLNVTACLAKPITSEQIASHVRALGGVRSILIVDDDMGFVQLVQRSIEHIGTDYSVTRAYDGRQALEILAGHQPDLVLLDLAMPEVDGFEVLEALRANPHSAQIPVILLTATRYIQDELEHNTEMIIRQTDGLRPKEVLHCLKAVIDQLEPRYEHMAGG